MPASSGFEGLAISSIEWHLSSPLSCWLLFMKLHFNFLSMVVHGFFYLPPMESLDNSNGILISRPTQNIYILERPNERIYN